MTQVLNAAVSSLSGASSYVRTMTDSVSVYSDVVAAGYLSAQQALGEVFQSSDVLYISYVGGAGFFNLSIDVNNIITLSPSIVTLNTNLVASVAITAAEFKGMYAAPKLLVAAPGANKILIPSSVQLIMTYGTAAYAAGGTAAVQYDSTVNGGGVIATSTLANTVFQATASNVFNMNRGVVAMPFSTCVNKGLYLSNITTAYTTGDSAMVANVNYAVLQVA